MRKSGAIEKDLMPIAVVDLIITSGKDRTVADFQRYAIRRHFIGGSIGPIIGQRTDPHPAEDLNHIGGEELVPLRPVVQVQHLRVVPTDDSGRTTIGGNCHTLQGRRDGIGNRNTIGQRIYRHILAVAQLQVQMGKPGTALTAPGDEIAAANRNLAFFEIEIHAIARTIFLSLEHALG